MPMSKETTDGDPMEPSSACYGFAGPPEDDRVSNYDPEAWRRDGERRRRERAEREARK